MCIFYRFSRAFLRFLYCQSPLYPPHTLIVGLFKTLFILLTSFLKVVVVVRGGTTRQGKGAATAHAHSHALTHVPTNPLQVALVPCNPRRGGAKGTIQFSLFINFPLILGASKRRFVIKFGELPARHKSRRSPTSLTMSMMRIFS